MTSKIIAIVSIIIALIVSILGLTLSPENLQFIVKISRFFEMMIPFLVVGALFKYLLCSSSHHHHH